MLTVKESQPYFLTPSTNGLPSGSANNKPLFVFLPGMDGTGELLHNQVAELSREFEIRCLAIPPDLLMSWEDLTAQVIKLIETEIAARSPRCVVYLCGESFGGCLALNVATQAPQLCDRSILVNPAISCHRHPWLGWGEHIVQYMNCRRLACYHF
jgi:pimeloyl-ACP methyl ester carboxylesterase